MLGSGASFPEWGPVGNDAAEIGGNTGSAGRDGWALAKGVNA